MVSKEYNTTVTLSKQKARSKEECLQVVRRFRSEYEVVELTLEELAMKLVQGYMVIPAEMESHKKEGFVSSDLIMIDIDSSSLKGTALVSKLSTHGLVPAFAYHTFSSTPAKERFRLVYRLSDTIDEADRYQDLIIGFHEMLNGIGIKTDKQTRDLNRVSFGGKMVFHMDEDAVLDVEVIPAPTKVPGAPKVKQLALDIDTGVEIAELLKQGDWEKLQEAVAVQLPENFFELSFIEKLNSIGIAEFFQLPQGQFSCLFHEDNNPSAGVIHTGRNEMYHCFSCGESLNLVSVIGKLMGGTVHDAIQALEVILQVKFGTDYQERMLKVSHQHKKQVRLQLETEHPDLHAWLERSNLTGFYLALIDIGLDLVTDIPLNTENDLTFFTSLRTLVGQVKPFGLSGVSEAKTVGKKINLLSEVGLVVKESDIKEQSFIDQAVEYKRAKGYRYRTSYLTVPMTADTLSQANRLVKQRKESGVRNGFTSSTQAFNQDQELAEKVYNQTDMEGLEKVVRAEQEVLLQLGMGLIEENGYFTEKMLSDKLQELGNSKKRSEKTAGAYRPFLLSYFELVTVTNKLKEEAELPAELKPRMKIYMPF